MEDALSVSSSPGDAVSARGYAVPDEDEDDELFYIPERRPSLDLGPSPMDSGDWQVVRFMAPALSYSSLTSDESLCKMDIPDEFSTRVQLHKTDSYSSCYSLDSDDCEKIIPRVKAKDDAVSELPDRPELIQQPGEVQHPSLTVAFTFKAVCKTLGKLSEMNKRRFQRLLWKNYPEPFNNYSQGMDVVDLVDMVDRLLECYSLQVSLQITKAVLEEIGEKRKVDYLQTLCLQNEVRHDLCQTLKRTYGEVCEDGTMRGDKRPLDDVFNDLCITSTCNNGPNIEHEVMTIEKLDTNREAGKMLSTKDILSEEQSEHVILSLVLVTGVAGSGKSMAVRRLILDWIEERSHQHVSLLFPLPFRELKQFESAKVSLVDIIQTLYPETKKLKNGDFRCEDCKIMLVFDGLDEYSGKLDFENTELLADHTQATSLNVIVVNLLRGRLLYHGLFMVTSRPPVKQCVPWDTYYSQIEVCGFCDTARDDYFKRRFEEPAHADAVIAYVSSLKSLRIMCHLPLFCSLVANECQQRFKEGGPQAELPRSVCYMYTKLLLALMRHHRAFRAPNRSPEEERDFLMKLGELAFSMLKQGKFRFSDSDWKEFGVSDEEAVINSGLCTQYLIRPFVLHYEKVYSFIHPTMQEYLAALYAFLSFRNLGKNILEVQPKGKLSWLLKGNKEPELYKSALDRSLLCEDGKLDMFLRFLCGMALTTNLELLTPFCASSVKWPAVTDDVAALIRKRIRGNQHPDRNDNLQRCLEELGVGASEAASS